MEVQTRLHARACQIAREVLTLLYAGFAEGAMARWRALHELAVVSLFIGHDEELAERYRFHEAVESRKVAVQYRKHTEKLGLEPITDAEFEQMEADVATLKKRFGKGYGESYGWAVERLRKIGKRATFDKIEEAAELGHLRPYYQLASHSVHANPKGAFYRLGLVDQTEMLLAGPSSYGLADAGQNTAISLGQITSALVSLAPTLDEIVAMKVAISMVDHVLERFAHVQRELQAEEGECANTDTKLLIYGLFQKGRVLAQDGDKLTRFLRVPGAPLDNNLCERALKKAILHRKNSLFYKTKNGARGGDIFLSLIHTAELNGVDPFRYLTELIRHRSEIEGRTADWLPWNYRDYLTRTSTDDLTHPHPEKPGP